MTDPIYGPAASSQILATAASDGESYLVLWIDRRSYPTSTFATRLDADGRVLDPVNILIAQQEIFRPSIVWCGSSYFVVWRNIDDLWLTRIAADGSVVESPHVLETKAQPGRLATDGTRVAVGYLDRDSNTPRVLFLTQEGERSADLQLSEPGEYGAPQVVWNGSAFAAVWLRTLASGATLSIEGVRFDASGTIGTAHTLVSNDNGVDPALASDGSDFVLVTRDFGTGRHGARHISSDLDTVSAKSQLPAAISFAASIQWIGSSYVVTGEHGATVNAVRLDRNGRPLDNGKVIDNVVESGLAPSPTLASNGRNLLVAWAGTPATALSDSDVYGAVVDASTLTRQSRELLSVSSTRQLQPVIATNGSALLTLWLEGQNLYARRSTRDGRPIDATPLRLSDNAWAAAVTFNGTSYTAAWVEENAVVTRRVYADGVLRADGGSRITTKPPAVVALAGNVFGWGGNGVNVARLRPDASVLDGFPLRLTNASVGKIAVSPNDGGDCLVVWGELEDTPYSGPIPRDVRGARVSPGLTNLDGSIDIATTSGSEGDPAVTWNGSEWLVLWSAAKEVRGRRIARNGTFDGSDALVASNAFLPAVMWDGARYFLAWHEATKSFGVRLLRTARLAQLGAELSAVRTIGDAETYSLVSMSFAPIAPDAIASSYARIAREPQYGGVPRAFIEVLSFAPRRRAM
ncbi:MAG TPA: hypothetical protein VMU84_08925 [Thermoanaerobaculia bacterium]|nr:hypothetical protein [Thermoanaerobaculia bacterium]